MKMIYLKSLLASLLATVFLFSAPVWAEVDHWKTAEECVAATAAPYYFPTIIGKQKLAEGEIAQGRLTPSCVDMELPDRLGGRGWVKVGSDRKIIFNQDGKAVRLAECNNRIYAVVALPAVEARDGRDGKNGKDGAPGPPGRDGYNGRDGYDGRDAVIPDPCARYEAGLNAGIFGFYGVTAGTTCGYQQQQPVYYQQSGMVQTGSYYQSGNYQQNGNYQRQGGNHRDRGGPQNTTTVVNNNNNTNNVVYQQQYQQPQRGNYHQPRQQYRPQYGGGGGHQYRPPTPPPPPPPPPQQGRGPGAHTGGYR